MDELSLKSTQNILLKYVPVVDTKTKKAEVYPVARDCKPKSRFIGAGKPKLNLFVLPRLAGFATCDFEINADVNAAKNILASAPPCGIYNLHPGLSPQKRDFKAGGYRQRPLT